MITQDTAASRNPRGRASFESAVGRFEDSTHDDLLSSDDPRISTQRHIQRVRPAEARGRGLVVLAVAGTIGAVTLAPTIARGISALVPERFACDPNTPQALYSGPNAFSVATEINGDDWKDVPLRQAPDSEPVAAANMSYTFTGSAYGPVDCR